MTVRKIGPFFDGDAGEELKIAVEESSEDIAEELLITWYISLDQRIRVNQHRYLSGLTKDEQGDGAWRVHDDISYVYGPWLEGLGSQNPRSRFPGYGALRQSAAQVSGSAVGIVERRISEAVEELGGR